MLIYRSRSARELYSELTIIVATILAANAATHGQLPSKSQVPLAVGGQPFGVLVVDVPLPPDWDGRMPRVLLSEQSGRLFYPVVETLSSEQRPGGNGQVALPRLGRPGGLIDRVREALRPAAEKRQVPAAVRVLGLFRGNEPIKLSLSGDINQQITFAVDQFREVSQRQLFDLWWEAYAENAARVVSRDDAPKLLHYYLTSMLANRFGLPTVDLDPPKSDEKSIDSNQPLETLELLTAIEPLREEIFQCVLRESWDSETEVPIPAEPLWQAPRMPPVDPKVTIEPIAGKIPAECFYLRFGSFNNYVWFQELADRFDGDLTQAVFLRGFNHESSARMERMLATKLTAVAKMFGDKLIADLALFGSDLYMKEGASVGVVFQASNPALLRTVIEAERRSVLAQNPDARLQDLVVDGVRVSLLSTPDNRLRSFLLIDEQYFLISTSQHLVERFIQIGRGEPSLASTIQFRAARSWMPEQNSYSVFGYFSPDFFHRLVSPHYQIELRRRLEAVAHLEIANIASLTASAEGEQADSLEQMKQLKLLPAWFDQRPDRSRVLRSGNCWIDALRGSRGSFLPIADVKITSVSPTEAAEYARLAEFYQRQWQHMDPILLGIRRFQGAEGVGETVAVEAHIAPFEPKKYGWLAEQLADPGPIEIQLPDDDAASIQLHVRGIFPGESYYLFGGVKDMSPPEPEDVQGLIKTLRALKAVPAYIGAWPKPGFVDQLPLGLGGPLSRPDPAGYSRMIGGLWRWQDEQWSLLSFNRQILEGAIPQLATVPTSEQAQARAHIANLQGSQLAQWVNELWWERSWRASHGNAELLDTMYQQLKVPSDQCLAVTSELMDAQLQCPLGGEFIFEDNRISGDFPGWWKSTAWQAGSRNQSGKPVPPADYQAPWVGWFRGAKVQATQLPSSLSIVGVLHLDLPPLRIESTEAGMPTDLPAMNFDIFSLPLKMFGKSEAERNAVDGQPAATVKKSF